VVTATPVRVMVMSHAQFRDAIKSNDPLLSTVIAAMADRLRRDQVRRAAGP
jgi:CRP-like cAMP-binding protein